MKTKIIKAVLAIVIFLAVVYSTYGVLALQGQILGLSNNTFNYIQLSNQAIEQIICAGQVLPYTTEEGVISWDLTQCPQ